MDMMRRVMFMMWKEVLELRQDPRIFSIIFIAPILQLTVLGYAATTDVRNVPVVIVDADRSRRARRSISRFQRAGHFQASSTWCRASSDVDPYLEGGTAWMALSIPPRYGEDLGAGRPVSLQIVADGSDASSTNIAMGYASNLDRRLRAGSRRERSSGTAGGTMAASRAASIRACASGSIRRSRAATSCCRASSRCCCWW